MKKTNGAKKLTKGNLVAAKVQRVFELRDRNISLLNPAARIPKQDWVGCSAALSAYIDYTAPTPAWR